MLYPPIIAGPVTAKIERLRARRDLDLQRMAQPGIPIYSVEQREPIAWV